MPTRLTINVRNQTSSTQNFYFFQQPAVFTGGSMVYSNSLYSQSLPSYDQTGAVLTVQADAQIYAAIQQAHSMPAVGKSSGYASASRPIDLTSSGSSMRNWTTASVNPLGLTQPTAGSGVQPGAFRITTPVYAPPAIYNIGSAVQVNGGVGLSSFVLANPANHTDCMPVPKFYVQTGSYTAGTVINFTSSSVYAAICDFGGGYSTMNVALNADGSWTVQIVQ